MPTWRSWLGLGPAEQQQDDPVQRTLDVLGQGAQQAQPSFAPEDSSTSAISPPAPPQPAISAPFQDTYTPAPEPAPVPAVRQPSFAPEDASSSAIMPPGTLEPPTPTGGASLGSLAASALGAANAGLGQLSSVVLPSPEYRADVNRRMQESARGLPLPTPQQVAAPIDVALGNQPGMTLQAAQDVSGVLGPPEGLVTPAARAVPRAAAQVAEEATPGVLARAGAAPAEPGVMELGSGLVPERPLYSPEPPPGTQRRYHGTASAFDAADPARFDENGLYGPGYYTTSDPRVASSYADQRNYTPGGLTPLPVLRANRLTDEIQQAERHLANPRLAPDDRTFFEGVRDRATAELDRVTRQGPNVRALDLPADLRMLDVDAPLTDDALTRVDGVIATLRRSQPELAREFDDEIQRLADDAGRRRGTGAAPLTNDALYAGLDAAAGRMPDMGKGLATEILERAGYDGIAHTGGQRVPLLDASGTPIEHDVSVIFPGSINKVRNAFSGTYGGAGMVPSLGPGARAAAFNAAQGGVLGAASEQLQAGAEDRPVDYGEELRRAGMGAGLGLLAGNRAARGAVVQGARELGSGLVPRGIPDPDAIANAARRAADIPMTGPHTDADHTVRNIGQQIRKQADRGVAPEVPAGPMVPPGAEKDPNLWDWAQAVRYGLGLFGNLSTALTQAGGGAAEIALGAPEELVRRAILRGRPEALPGIAAAGVRAVPDAFRAAWATAKGEVPEALLQSSDYRPPLSARLRAAGKETQADIAGALEFPGRAATQAPDAGWRELYYQTGLAQAAADAAEAETGLTRSQRLARQAELTANPTPEIQAQANALADDATYKGDLGYGLSLLQKIIRGGPDAPEYHKAIGSALMPVYHTIARITEGGLARTPGLGLLPLEKVGLAAKARPMDQRIAQQVVGTGYVGALMAYAANGGIRGPGPSDPNEAQALRDQGRQENTINIGGYWIPTSWLGRPGVLVNEVGALHDAMLYDDRGKTWDEAAASERVNRVVRGFARSYRDYPFAQSAATLLHLLDDPSQTLASFAGQYAGQYVPGVVRQTLTGMDPYSRRAGRVADVGFLPAIGQAAEASSGVGRQALPAAQDILGRDVANPRQGLASFAPRVGTDRPDPIIQAYVDAGLNIGDPPKQLGGFTLEPGFTPPELTAEEQRRWNALRGEALIRRVEPMLADPRFQAASAEARAKGLDRARSEAATEAHARLRSEVGAQEINRRISEQHARKAS
ncbi:MAG TPA: hypothetical protein VF076_07175 [Acidimicrobiales bacterium]